MVTVTTHGGMKREEAMQTQGQRLIQFQCLKEGTLFYYQHGNYGLPFEFQCPLCGSRRVEQTGREFAPVDEMAPIKAEAK